MENRFRTEYHFFVFRGLYNHLYETIIQFVEVINNGAPNKKYGFNFLWKSCFQMTDYTLNERIKKIILYCSSMVSPESP